ncbi:MAG: thiamine phosphate synthase [Oscillospiraceae bacterium]|nr:thiamine phosphate synthase [Oscillospiraceae bacterium]
MQIKSEELKLYAITDRNCLKNRDFEQSIAQALAGGVTCLQLREKNLSRQELLAQAIRIKRICDCYHVKLMINDDYEIALEAGVDGVHVGITDTPVKEIRNYAGENFIIGATAKTLEQAIHAQDAGADYLGVGAIFPSGTKPEAIRITPEIVKQIRKAVKIPIVGIGGITQENVSSLAAYHLDGIAVVSAVFGADKIQDAAENLLQIMKGWND